MMKVDIHEFSLNLVSKICHSEPGAHVIWIVDTAIKTLFDNQVHNTVITQFIDTVNYELKRLYTDVNEQEQLHKIFHTASVRLRKLKMNLMEQEGKLPFFLTISKKNIQW